MSCEAGSQEYGGWVASASGFLELRDQPTADVDWRLRMGVPDGAGAGVLPVPAPSWVRVMQPPPPASGWPLRTEGPASTGP